MSKRFTDTTKWDDDWYLNLPPKMKLAWNYICDTCDGCGTLKVSFGLISFRIGESVARADFDQHFDDRIVWLKDDQIWIFGFIAFQYKTLSPKNHAHRGIMAKIIKLADGLPLTDSQLTLIRGWNESLMTLKDIGLGNRKKDSSSEEGECEGILKAKEAREIIGEIYKSYPRREGKTPGMNTLMKTKWTRSALEELAAAVKHYAATCKAKGRAGEYILLWSTFANQWEDWKDPTHGSAQDFSDKPQSLDDIELPDYSGHKEGA